MDDAPLNVITLLTSFAFLGATVGGLAVWGLIFRRVLSQRPVVRFSPRRQVPWNGLDVFAVLFASVVFASLLAFAISKIYGESNLPGKPAEAAEQPIEVAAGKDKPAPAPDNEPIDVRRSHPIMILLNADSSAAIVLLCILSVVVMAPVAEEFFFRLLLQGYLEKINFRHRRLLRHSARLVGLWPLLLTSVLFASLHARGPRQEIPPVDDLIYMIATDTFSKVVLVLGAIVYLRKFRGATWKDLGIRFDTLGTDVRLALGAFLAVFVPIIAFQFGLSEWFPDYVPDPVPLFPLALALGYLYLRTHRILPSLLLHLFFNASSMALFFAMMASS